MKFEKIKIFIQNALLSILGLFIFGIIIIFFLFLLSLFPGQLAESFQDMYR